MLPSWQRIGVARLMLRVCDGCKDMLNTDQDGTSGPLASLAPFRARGAHPSKPCKSVGACTHITNVVVIP